MSQKVQIYRNTNEQSAAFGKYFVRAVYDEKFVTTNELADFIQTQCTVKRSDCKAVLDELGAALKHFFEFGQKVKIDNVGVFKVGVKSSASATLKGCTASNVRQAHVVFTPETESVGNGQRRTVRRARIVGDEAVIVESPVRGYSHPVRMLKDVRFELAGDSQGSGLQGSAPADTPQPAGGESPAPSGGGTDDNGD